MTDITKVFKAEPISIAGLLGRGAQGIHLPAYQRAYSWDARDVARLLEDAVQGMTQLLGVQRSIRFLGTIIGVDDKLVVGAPESLEVELPDTVLTIVDGQQRLCTLVVLNVLLHEAFASLVDDLGTDDASAWLREQIQDYMHVLEGSFRFKAKSGDAVWSFYPKVVRALVDTWGRHPAIAAYASPIAAFLWAYTYRLEKGRKAAGTWTPPAGAPPVEEALAVVIDHLRASLEELSVGEGAEIAIPDPRVLAGNANVQAELWPNRFPQQVLAAIEADDDPRSTTMRIVRLFALARYVNARMAVTLVTSSTEDYAFDVFEALNTTGQPLTAFETFRPLVIQAEGEGYAQSVAMRHVEDVQAYLSRFVKADERQKATTTLMTPFALVDTGQRLESHLSAQRRYLRTNYQAIADPVDRRAFTADLALLARFIGDHWDSGLSPAPLLPGGEGDEQASFCFEALRGMRHDVVLAPLLPFFGACVARPGGQAARAAYFGAIRAVAAFSVLWRAAKGGTAGIDGEYRKLMRQGLEGSIPLARRRRDREVGLADLREALRARLARAYPDRASWVEAVVQKPVLLDNLRVTRFLLMAASHDAVPDVTAPGLVTSGRLGSGTLLRGSSWRDPALATVEHVAPKSAANANWDPAIYADDRTVNQLGNLVLMPALENEAARTNSWPHKRALYAMFASESVEQAEAAMTTARGFGYTVGTTVQDLVAHSSVLPLCRAIAAYQGEWDVEFVRRRSTRLAELAYDRTHAWLEQPPPADGRRRRRGR